MNRAPFFDHPVFKKKGIDELMEQSKGDHSLKRTLKTFDLVMLGIGGVIGMGIFVLSGVVAGLHAGNAMPVSFLIAGVACMIAALCYAEFATLIPVAGSAYTYCYVTLGEIWAWIIGWDLILEYGLAVSAVAIGWSGYMNALLASLGLVLPPALVHPLGIAGGIVNLPAIIIIACLSLLLIRGTKTSARTNAIIVGIKIAVILLFVVLGAFAINPANWTPFMPPAGWLGIFSGAAIIFFAFCGFDAVVTAAEETKDPQKSLPRGLIGSLAICIVLYIILGIVLTGVVPFSEFAGAEAISAPIPYALQSMGVTWGVMIVSVGALCGMTSVILVMLFGQSRIFFAMSRDGLLPGIFSQVNKKTETPSNVILITGFFTAIIAGFFPLQIVAELVNMGTLAAFAIVAAGLLILRAREPDLPRTFRCPWVPFLPLACIGICTFLIFNLNHLAHAMFVFWLCIGLVVYFIYGMNHSGNRKADGLPLCETVPRSLPGPEFISPDPHQALLVTEREAWQGLDRPREQ
ncbi:MAG: amino acid permease [Methanoregula sp.]|nr:amino acid permease [Methanoregula sp.]